MGPRLVLLLGPRECPAGVAAVQTGNLLLLLLPLLHSRLRARLSPLPLLPCPAAALPTNMPVLLAVMLVLLLLERVSRQGAQNYSS